MVLTPEGAAKLAQYKRSTIIVDMPPPSLVVEVVSPGKKNRDRDYRFKRSEYAARGIEHYWIIDPQDKKFVCLELQDGLYEEKIFNNFRETISFERPFELKIKLEEIFFDAF
ncbi:Uma2 family endonuclease [Pleurocapsales cyanobacterium LEGE 10410]|nr:Uma2 family endonuclease [Pleurocapsales cyanobacterium LEGE 10410]